MTKEALLRFTVVLFSGKLIFHGVLGHSYASIKLADVSSTRRRPASEKRRSPNVT